MIKKRVIIAGPRDFYNDNFVQSHIEEELKKICFKHNININEIEIIEGGATGVDSIAKQYATKKQIAFTEFQANWAKYGKMAGPIRNNEMAKYGDILIAFSNGSRGTNNMIKAAVKENIEINIINIEDIK